MTEPRRVLAVAATCCALAALALACERTADPPATAAADTAAVPDSVPPISCVEFTEHGLTFDATTRAQLQQALGPPLSVDATVPAGAGGAHDSLFVARYDGVVVSTHKPGGGTELIDEVRVTHNRYLRHPQIGIGTPVDVVISALGPPGDSADEQLVYACHSSPARDDPVTFRIAGGRVTEIVFTYYMD